MAIDLNNRLAKLRALIVDDMATMRQNLRSQLGQLGIAQVDQAVTPNDAIRYISSTSYDVIICDYNLNKETNGQQMLEFLRSKKMLSPTSMFFMVTAESNYDNVASAAEFQPDAYMVKPLTGGKIADRIERLLDKQSALKPITDRLQIKDLAGAIAECDKVLKVDPKWIVDILKTKASASLELGRIDDARMVYTKALDLRNDLVWAKLGLARCDQVAGRLDEAKAIVQEVLEKNPRFADAYDLLAQIAESQGNNQEALDALSKSYDVIPSAYRSRMVGDAAYRVGDLDLARTAYDKALTHTKGSLTAQISDALSLAQVHVDSGEPEIALSVLSAAAKDHQEDKDFAARKATIATQAFVELGDMESAKAAYESAKSLAEDMRADMATLSLAKAAFRLGEHEEGRSIMSKAVKADHENVRLVAFARKVLQDTGNEELIEKIIDQSINEGTLIVNQAAKLMRDGQFDESLAKLEEALAATPENTGVLLAAAQLHLLWMSQKGVNRAYIERVNGYLAQLDVLIPNSERVAKMYRFLRETLGKVSSEA